MVIKNQDTGKISLNPENVSETVTWSRHASGPLGWALFRLLCPLPPLPLTWPREYPRLPHSTKLTQKEKHKMNRFYRDFHSVGFSSGPWSMSPVHSHEIPVRGHRCHKEHRESHPVEPVRNLTHTFNTELRGWVLPLQNIPLPSWIPRIKITMETCPLVSRKPWQIYIMDIWGQVHMTGLPEEGTRSWISPGGMLPG